MLELRPGCECCDKDLPPDSADALICSFECTFCADCVVNVLHGKCPNCGGELVARPRRPENKLEKNPPSTKRVFNPACRAGRGCVVSGPQDARPSKARQKRAKPIKTH